MPDEQQKLREMTENFSRVSEEAADWKAKYEVSLEAGLDVVRSYRRTLEVLLSGLDDSKKVDLAIKEAKRALCVE